MANICSIEDCGRKVHSKGHCSSHARQRRLGVPFSPIRDQVAWGTWVGQECSVDGCSKDAKVGGMCPPHREIDRRRESEASPTPPGYPRPWTEWKVNSQGYVHRWRMAKPSVKEHQYEHRVVMEGILGRPLFPNENVHHKNGVRSDNSSGNLELWVKSQPSGQRPADLVRWAEEIIARYGPDSRRLF